MVKFTVNNGEVRLNMPNDMTELGKVAFMSSEELRAETKRLKKKTLEKLMENDDLMHDILKAVFK